VDLTISYRVHEPLKVRMRIAERDIQAEVTDLSESGMSLVTNYDIPTSTILLMKFSMVKLSGNKEDKKTIHIIGEVRYNILLGQAGHRLGINFSDIRKEDKETLYAFILNVLTQ